MTPILGDFHRWRLANRMIEFGMNIEKEFTNQCNGGMKRNVKKNVENSERIDGKSKRAEVIFHER